MDSCVAARSYCLLTEIFKIRVIDPHAIVHPDAVLGQRVSIGPYSIVEAGVEIGDDTWIGPHVVIRGNTRVGRENKIYQFCSIGEDPQFIGYAGEPTRLEIGDRNIVREYCTLNRGSHVGTGLTRIGNDNFIMAYVHIAHDCEIADRTIMANCSSLAGHVSIGDYAILGGFTLVHQFCRIGPHCMTGINSICLKDVPPYVMASGNPAQPHGLNTKGLRRRGFSEQTIGDLKTAYRTLYRSRIALSAAVDELETQSSGREEVGIFMQFVKSSERGIIR